MAFEKVEHEIHARRKGRNIGVGLMLGAFVVLVLALTYVKVTGGAFEASRQGLTHEVTE